MKILGIDPSLKCTGYCIMVSGDNEKHDGYVYAGSISTKPMELNERIHEIIMRLEVRLQDSLIGNGYGYDLDMVFIEGEAMQASGQVVQLAELCGAIKYHFTSKGIKVLTYTPSQARKMSLGKGTIPFKKDKQMKEYIDFIRDKIRSENQPYNFGYDDADRYDALVIAHAASHETYEPAMSMLCNPELILMRLHDEKILTKNHQKVYSFGTGKKKVKFKTWDKVPNEISSVLLKRYCEIFEKGRGT